MWDNTLRIRNFDKKTVSELAEINNITIEKGVGIKRADVLVKFKEIHPILGRGIAFEIQLSNQNEITTKKRTFERAAQGFSICWLWSEDVIKLGDYVDVIPFVNAYSNYQEAIKEDYDEFLKDLQFRTNLKQVEISKQLSNSLESIKNQYSINVEILENKYKTKLRECSSLIETIDSQKTYIEKRFEDLKTIFVKNIEEAISQSVPEVISSNIKEYLSKVSVDELINKKINEFNNKFNELLSKENIVDFYKTNLKLSLECSTCHKIVPVPLCFWNKQKPYCYKCFLEVNKNDQSEIKNKIY